MLHNNSDMLHTRDYFFSNVFCIMKNKKHFHSPRNTDLVLI